MCLQGKFHLRGNGELQYHQRVDKYEYDDDDAGNVQNEKPVEIKILPMKK